jgi:hypothetical protein
MSLYENINRRRKLGISRSKADSTISKGSYSNMKKGFPEKGLIEKKGEVETYGRRFSRCLIPW